jgi:hypothetical protein
MPEPEACGKLPHCVADRAQVLTVISPALFAGFFCLTEGDLSRRH